MRIPFVIPPAGSRPWDVVGLGQNSLDLVAVLAEYPARDSKQRLQQFARLPGGQIATALVACARLGWRARYIGRFGDDEHGRLSRESLTAEGVDLTGARSVPGSTNQFAIVLVDTQSGSRTILYDRHPALSMTPDDVPTDIVGSGRLLLVDSLDPEAAAAAAQAARAARMPTIVDVEAAGPGVTELLQHIDAIIAAEGFPSELTGCADVGHALEAMQQAFGAPLVCVTLGADGSLARCGGREIRTRAYPVASLDSTGAGDAFRGGFASALLRNPDGDIEDALAYANAVAALNCRALGARGGLPTAAEVERLVYGRF